MNKISRRAFLGASGATIATALLPPGRLAAQALPAPVYTLTGGLSSSGVVSAGTSLQYSGASVALRSGERAVISRVAQQVAASGVTRAVATRTMSAVATRLLVGAASASPWGLAALGLGAVAYGAYRYFTADDEAGGTSTTTQYSVLYDQNGAATINAAVSNGNCGGLPSNSGGQYPDNVIIGAYNGVTGGGCQPGFRQRVVFEGSAAAQYATPSGWTRAYVQDLGYLAGQPAGGIKRWVIFLTKAFPVVVTGGQTTYQPMPVPVIPDPAFVPDALPAQVKAKPVSKAVLADVANGLWKMAVPITDPLALPWSPPVTVPALDPVPVPLPYSPPATPLAPPVAPPVGDITTPLTPLFPPGTEVKFEYPPEIKFSDDTNPDPDPDPDPDPGTGGGKTEIDWGTPPSGEMPGAPTPFAWVPTPWTAPDLPGQCTGLPYNFPVLHASGSINPCPALEQARPVVRPVAILGWTVYAIAQFLDL